MGKLIYFPFYGRAEPTRMLLAHAGEKYEEQTVPMSEWGALKPEMPGNTIPVWVDENGLMLGQSISILQALSRKLGYAPKGFLGDWANQWGSDTIADCLSKGYTGKLFGPAVDEATLKAWVADNLKLNMDIEKHLGLMNTKFLAGDNLTASDFHFYAQVTSFAHNKHMNHQNVHLALKVTHRTPVTPKLNAWLSAWTTKSMTT